MIKKAQKLALCRDLTLLLRGKGQFTPFPSITEAHDYDYSETDKQIIEQNRPKSLYGTPQKCRSIIEEMAGKYNVDEFLILSICHDPEDRQNSYELIADAFRK